MPRLVKYAIRPDAAPPRCAVGPPWTLTRYGGRSLSGPTIPGLVGGKSNAWTRPTGPSKVTARGGGIHSVPNGTGPPCTSTWSPGRSTSMTQRPAGESTPAPDSSSRVPRVCSMQISDVTGAWSGAAVPSCSMSATSSSPFVRTATTRPSSRRANHRVPSTQSGPPVSASSGATDDARGRPRGARARCSSGPSGRPRR